MEKIRILILAANPWETERLDLGEEYQRIQDLWERADYKERFELRHYPALRGEALQEKVLKFKPHIIHFSGHGGTDSIIFTDVTGDKAHEVSKSALAELFKLCASDLKAVFLNACYSANQAKEIVDQVDYVIGMNAAINDLAAIKFAEGFYTAIFSQDTLDIEPAFAAGLNQMALTHITEAEQKKPVIQKRRHTYVSSYQHDVFINFADADAQWANDLTDYLRKQFKQKLATADGFQLYTGNNFSQLKQSAMLLVITSPAYYQQYQAQLEQLATQAKQSPLFLVDYEASKRPECLKGTFSNYRFWNNEDLTALTGEDYFAKANELADALTKRLKELKDQHQRQQSVDQQREQQQKEAREKNTKGMDAFIFINSAEEDLNLIKDIKPLLEENGIGYFEPLVPTIETSSGDIYDDIESKIINCDALLILYEKTTPKWIRNQLGICMRVQRKREEPLKIIAVYKHPEKPDIGYFPLNNLHIYCCKPDQITKYLSEFIKVLSHE
jgi:hypothetical protein